MLLTTGQAAEELGSAITTFRRLARAGLLPGLSARCRVMVPLETVQALRDRPPAPRRHLAVCEIGVLRVDAARPGAGGGPCVDRLLLPAAASWMM